jgi:hypothetical protein
VAMDRPQVAHDVALVAGQGALPVVWQVGAVVWQLLQQADWHKVGNACQEG